MECVRAGPITPNTRQQFGEGLERHGVAAVASQIAWVLFVIGIVLLIVHMVSGRRTLAP